MGVYMAVYSRIFKPPRHAVMGLTRVQRVVTPATPQVIPNIKA
jgi:hypothetical protein